LSPVSVDSGSFPAASVLYLVQRKIVTNADAIWCTLNCHCILSECSSYMYWKHPPVWKTWGSKSQVMFCYIGRFRYKMLSCSSAQTMSCKFPSKIQHQVINQSWQNWLASQFLFIESDEMSMWGSFHGDPKQDKPWAKIAGQQPSKVFAQHWI